MATRISSNIDEVIRYWEAALRTRDHWLVIVNESPWAMWLQRRGYWVMNDGALANIVYRHLDAAVNEASAAGEMLDNRRIVRALDGARREIVRYYQQVVGSVGTRGRMAPPPRPLHRGGWADDTETTAKSFVSYIDNARELQHPY